jgi:hypothetical protein
LLSAIIPRITGRTLVRLLRSRRLHEPTRQRKSQVGAFLS